MLSISHSLSALIIQTLSSFQFKFIHSKKIEERLESNSKFEISLQLVVVLRGCAQRSLVSCLVACIKITKQIFSEKIEFPPFVENIIIFFNISSNDFRTFESSSQCVEKVIHLTRFLLAIPLINGGRFSFRIFPGYNLNQLAYLL